MSVHVNTFFGSLMTYLLVLAIGFLPVQNLMALSEQCASTHPHAVSETPLSVQTMHHDTADRVADISAADLVGASPDCCADMSSCPSGHCGASVGILSDRMPPVLSENVQDSPDLLTLSFPQSTSLLYRPPRT